MDNQEEQNNIEVQPDLYLESPKAFHLEMPPYHNFDLSTKAISKAIYEILSNRSTIDAYCIWCEKKAYLGHTTIYLIMFLFLPGQKEIMD